MQNQEINQHIHQLISRYLSGNVTEDQVRELEEWVAARPENKHVFMEMKQAWMLTGMSKNTTDVNIEAAWRGVSNQVFDQDNVVPLTSTFNRRRWMSIAASMVLLATASFLIYQFIADQPTHYLAAANQSEEILLADGSQVVLNRSSSLRYGTDKKDNQRQVELQGDAYFNVARDESRPFIINTDDVEIQVLGTSFYVDARSAQDQVHVIVESGKVAVRTDSMEHILVAGEKAVFNKKNLKLEKLINEDGNFNSIKTNTLVFEKSPLSTVIHDLNRQYNVNIQLASKQLSSCELTSTFQDKSLPAILEIIKSSLGINIRQSQNQILFEGNCTID